MNLYISNPNGSLKPLGEISEVTYTEPEAINEVTRNFVVNGAESAEATITIRLPHATYLQLVFGIKSRERWRQKVKARRAMLLHWRRVYFGEEVSK